MTESANPKDTFGAVKPNLNLVPPAAIAHEATAMMDGARKYGPFNWRKKDVLASIYVAAAMRHISSWFDGEENAQDSGRHHLGHARACLGIILDAQENKCLKDDRPKPGNYSVLVERLTIKAPKHTTLAPVEAIHVSPGTPTVLANEAEVHGCVDPLGTYINEVLNSYKQHEVSMPSWKLADEVHGLWVKKEIVPKSDIVSRLRARESDPRYSEGRWHKTPPTIPEAKPTWTGAHGEDRGG